MSYYALLLSIRSHWTNQVKNSAGNGSHRSQVQNDNDNRKLWLKYIHKHNLNCIGPNKWQKY